MHNLKIIIQEVERDLSSIDQIVQLYFCAHSKLIEMNIQITFDMEDALLNLFLYTYQLQMPLFAFFLTKERLYYYGSFCRQDNTFFESKSNRILK